jgi:hypothetical protein
MERTFVDSSMISSVGHSEEESILEIEFKSNGVIWQYNDVPDYVYQEMLNSDSTGKYFHQNIKDHYLGNRVA